MPDPIEHFHEPTCYSHITQGPFYALERLRLHAVDMLHDVSILCVIAMDTFHGYQEFINVLLYLVFTEHFGHGRLFKELIRFKELFHAARQSVQSGNFPESFN